MWTLHTRFIFIYHHPFCFIRFYIQTSKYDVETMKTILYLIAFIHILCLVIWNFFARIFWAILAKTYVMLVTTLDKRTLFAKLKNLFWSAAVAVELFKRNIKIEFLCIKALRPSAQVIIVSMCRNIGNAPCTVMAAITKINFKPFILLLCDKKIYHSVFMTGLNKSRFQMEIYSRFSALLKIIMNCSGIHFCKGIF